jgi:uncharacterized protein (TIGR00375 family)
LSTIAKTCEIRGIDIVATGDFTHPAWFKHIKENLVEENEGIYKLKDGSNKTKFIIGTEVASIKKHKDKTRRVHLLIFAPNIEIAEKFNSELVKKGFNLNADGRPILGATCKEILEIMFQVDKRMVMIPAHVWTPWFGIFGSKGGYNSLEEAFDELASYVCAVETGLSSDPLMNWRLSALDNITLVSNSDAHSLQKLGREANVFRFNNEKDITYSEIMRIIQEKDRQKFLNTIEFYPEEGKYHVDGHRDCNFFCTPHETDKLKGVCPKCNRPLVIGVLNRVIELADRTEEEAKKVDNIPYKNTISLPQILSDVFNVGINTKTVVKEYDKMIQALGSEFFILLEASLEEITKVSGEQVALAIKKTRNGDVFIRPGYDGEFGKIEIFKK